MSKVFYGNQSTAYNFDNYKKFQLPTSIREATNINNANRNKGNNDKNNNKSNDDKKTNTINTYSDIMTKDKLKLLLDREETYSDFLINSNPNQVILMNKVRPKMERILEAYACANQNKFALSGAVQLCAVILTTFNASNKPQSDNNNNNDDNNMDINYSGNNNDCQDTFFILQILTQIMRIYYDSDEKLMKDETLLLIDVLCVNEDKLVKKLNNLEIDVIDLSVFVSSWIRCLFVHHFEIEFVQRVIDLVLLEGPSVLIAIVYGILQFIKNDILQCDTHYDIFEKLAGNKLKNYLKKHEFIHRVIQKAQLLFTEENYKYVIKGREKKSWPDLLTLPGQKHFKIAKGVGDKTKVKKAFQHWRRESRKNIKMNAYLGAEESSDDSEQEDDQPNHHARNSSTTGYYYEDNNPKYNNKIQEMEAKLNEAQQTINKLRGKHGYNDSMNIGINIQQQAIPEDEQLNSHHPRTPTGAPMIESHDSLIIHNDDNHQQSPNNKRPSPISMHKTATSQLANANRNKLVNNNSNKHNKSQPTLSDILYTSQYGDKIYQEPITDNLAPREIQCRTENWTDSWKNALNSLTDASISMQGYLCKMTASKWNSRGTLDKIQRRWFVLRGNYMTYYKTNLHTQPKSDKCVDLTGYKVNPVVHSKSEYAFELISPPKENIHKKSKSQKKSSMGFGSNTNLHHHGNYQPKYSPHYHDDHDHHDPYSNISPKNNINRDYFERTKFILIPDLDVNEDKQKQIRDKWVKSLRLATKGAFLWDILLNLQIENNPNYYNNNDDNYHDHSPSHSKHGQHAHSTSNMHHQQHAQSSSYAHGSSSYHNLHSTHHHGGGNSAPRHPQVISSGNQSPLSQSNNNHDNHFQYNRRQYSSNKRQQNSSRMGGNTQDYPDYSSSKRGSGYPYK